jgi:hypothetical protein
LKLVNSLDFSRIEAGRVQANYDPTDLAVYTRELRLRLSLGHCLGHGMEETTNAAGLIADRAKREGEEGLLEVSVAVQEHSLILKKGSFSGEGAAKGLSDGGHAEAQHSLKSWPME